MSVRSASRGNPAASSIRLALRTSSIVATRRASFVRWVFRCFGRRCLSSAPKLSAISLMPSMMRFQLPPRPESLNHIPMPCVNNLSQKLIDDKGKYLNVNKERRTEMPLLCSSSIVNWKNIKNYVEGGFRIAAFEFTTDYGKTPGDALVLLGYLLIIFALIYV